MVTAFFSKTKLKQALPNIFINSCDLAIIHVGLPVETLMALCWT